MSSRDDLQATVVELNDLYRSRDVNGLIRYFGDLREDPDVDFPVRAWAARLAGRLRSEEAVPALSELLLDDNQGVRLAAITALGRVGTPGAEASLIDHLERNPDEAEALASLARIRTPPTSLKAIEVVGRYLKHPRRKLRHYATRLLLRTSDTRAREMIDLAEVPVWERLRARL